MKPATGAAMGVNTTFSKHWRKKIVDKVQDEPRLKEEHTIYKVPRNIRRCDMDAYTPRVISIGPYHHGDPNLKSMEVVKWRIVRYLTRKDDGLVRRYLDRLIEIEKVSRRCYMGEVVMKEEPFVEMLLADGCFILHYILKESKKIKSGMVEQTPGSLGVELQMYYDLLLLENQIPFFVVQELYTIFQSIKQEAQIVATEEEQSSLIDLAQNLFNKHHNYTKLDSVEAVKKYSGDCINVNHLLDLFHRSFTPTLPAAPNGRFLTNKGLMKRAAPCPTPISRQDILPTSMSDINVNVHPRITGSLTSSAQIKLSWVPNATELGSAGVKIKSKKNSKPLDISFDKSTGKLEIPPVYVNKYSNILFRNLIAFEQCNPNIQTYVTAYITFMDCIIVSSRDVALLHRKGIVMNGLSTEEEASKFFNKLCDETLYKMESFYLFDLITDVNKYHRFKWNWYRAKLMGQYFSTPWTFISFVAAFFLLSLTVIQTFYTIYPMYKVQN